MYRRAAFLCIFAGLIFVAAHGQGPAVRELAPGVFFWQGDHVRKVPANCTWIVFEDYVLAFDANSSNRPLENHHERMDVILDPRSNLMSTPARVPEQVSASVPERRSFLRGTASDPNDFVKRMSIAISAAERIR